MTISQDQFRAAIREVADEVTDHDVPALSLLAGDGAAPHIARRWRASNHRLLVSLAAALAVVAVIATSVILAEVPQPASSHARTWPGGAPARIRLDREGVPPYYLESGYGAKLEIRDTATGKTVATVRAPKPFDKIGFTAVAAEYWTFAFEAFTQKPYRRTASGLRAPAEPYQIFLAQFNPSTARVTVRRLSIPNLSVPETGLAGLALSPDGRELAIALQPDDAGQIMVYSLVTGRVKVWRAQGYDFFNGFGVMSWSSTGTLAFDKVEGVLTKTLGIWLLNTATPGGNLISDSRHLLDPPGGESIGAVLTPDGNEILMPVSTITGFAASAAVGTSEIEVFSVPTGRLLGALLRHTGRKPVYRRVIWTSASGDVLIVNMSNREFKDGWGVLRGDRITRLPGTRGLESYPVF
jgi:hypothetical protein